MDDSIATLEKRLPELEWQLQKLVPKLTLKSLPKGLFQRVTKPCVTVIIDELKFDLSRLRAASSPSESNFIATKLSQKINVLVMLCNQRQKNDKSNSEQKSFAISAISTRQQRLQSLEISIAALTRQQETLVGLAQNKTLGSAVKLSLQQELGLLQKQLTLAQEAYNDILS